MATEYARGYNDATTDILEWLRVTVDEWVNLGVTKDPQAVYAISNLYHEADKVSRYELHDPERGDHAWPPSITNDPTLLNTET